MSTEYNPAKIWMIVDSGAGEPAFNMALDEALLIHAAEIRHPVLRFYSWTEPAATFGYFQRFAEVAKTTELRPLIRRTTGGGIVPHDRDWTYSVIIPPGHEWHGLCATESYRQLHQWICNAFRISGVTAELADARRKQLPGQCFAGHEKHDVLLHGKKIAGAAQRRNRLGLLIQGSIQPPESAVRADWQTALLKAIQWEHGKIPTNAFESAQRLVSHYASREHNERR